MQGAGLALEAAIAFAASAWPLFAGLSLVLWSKARALDGGVGLAAARN